MTAAAASGAGPSIVGPATQPGRYLLGAKPIRWTWRAVLFLASDAAGYITGTWLLADEVLASTDEQSAETAGLPLKSSFYMQLPCEIVTSVTHKSAATGAMTHIERYN
jgi:hypothetical protein